MTTWKLGAEVSRLDRDEQFFQLWDARDVSLLVRIPNESFEDFPVGLDMVLVRFQAVRRPLLLEKKYTVRE